MAPDDEFLKQFNEYFAHREEALPDELEERRARELNEKEVKVEGVYEHPRGAFVLLRDVNGRRMPIWIGQAEALSISLALEGNGPPRPLTHDLLKRVLDETGATIEAALVDDLYSNTYYAKLTLRRNGSSVDIDCRPSDAIAMALRTKSPIYVADHVLEEAQVEWHEE
ncbi:MAG: bifunctional nuclease family protein [Armatimonadetes bacterium]|nr:bifunctional nuclease family protein [Armatimonadota bacterium]